MESGCSTVGIRSTARSRSQPIRVRLWTVALLAVAFVGAGNRPTRCLAQVVINEILPNNGNVPPPDTCLGTPDLIELLNRSDDTIALGTDDPATSYYLSDTAEFDPETAWEFPEDMAILGPGERAIVFCDGNILEALCELHAGFALSSDGSEPVTLWGPENEDGERAIIDQVWLPPLRQSVSIGRFPDGEGPAPVPADETLTVFDFYVAESDSPPTFGECVPDLPNTPPLCSSVGGTLRRCGGAPNAVAGIVDVQGPRIERDAHSTNRPAAMEPVSIRARVRDPDGPTPTQIEAVELRVRVDGGEWNAIPMEYDDVTGVRDASDRLPPRPLDQWTLWNATIDGQPAGAVVEFYFYVRDVTGLESTRPRELCETVCPDCTGPCDREFGGPDCLRDEDDVACDGGGGNDPCDANGGGDDDDDDDGEGAGDDNAVVGERYIACDVPFRYVSGFTLSADREGLVINEVVAAQDGLLEDPTQRDCSPSDACPQDNLDCCKSREDFVEIVNSSAEPRSLAGLWLTDSYFSPRGWAFPTSPAADVTLDPGERIIVWLDNDGAQCPDPTRGSPPCFWECPDPTNSALRRFHTDFALDLGGDQLFLVDGEAQFGIVHGVAWDRRDGVFPLEINQSLALIPDGDPSGCFKVETKPTPNMPNEGEPCGKGQPLFRRGDAAANGSVDLSDAIFILNFLFLGGSAPECPDAADADDSGSHELTDAIRILNFLFLGGDVPPPPGPDDPGIDPSDDDLADCVYPQ